MKKALCLLTFLVMLFGLVCCKEPTKTKVETKEPTPVTEPTVEPTVIEPLDVPSDFKIDGTIISFSNVANATKYRVEIRNVLDESIQRRFVSSGDDLNELNIPEGDYMIKIQAMNDLTQSEYSEEVSYKQYDLYAVKEIKEEALIDGNYIKWMGRTLFDINEKVNTMFYSASGFSVKVKKMETTLTLNAVILGTNTISDQKRPYIVLVLDDDFENTITIALNQAETDVTLIGEGGFQIDDEEVHTVSLYKRTESIDSHISLKEIYTSGKFVEGVTYKDRKIEVIAASSSTGYGNLGGPSGTKTSANSDALHAFAFLSSLALNAEINIVSASGWGIYASRWTSPNTINMKDKYKYVDVYSDVLWDTTSYVPDVIVTNFGTNDLSYIQAATTDAEKSKRTEAFISTYVEFLNNLHTTYPNAKIIVLYGLMNESGIYDNTIEIYNRAKETISDLEIIRINGDGRGCASHPSAASHATIAGTLTEKIKEVMGW